jgi:4-methylaminobutanoate oxidase (formaldehyde-forming)
MPQATGYKQCGSLTTAQTKDRFEVMKRNAARARSYGLEAELLTPRECGEKMSHDNIQLIRTDDLVGGLWLPGDGSGSPTDLTMSFAAGARKLGVKIFEGVGVRTFRTAMLGASGVSKVLGVETVDGHVIECDQLVLCAGQWSRQVPREQLFLLPSLAPPPPLAMASARLPG